MTKYTLPEQKTPDDCLHWFALNYRTAHTINAHQEWVELDSYFNQQIQIAYAAGQRDMQEAADAERYRWLRDSDNHRHEDDISVSDFDLNVYFGNDLDNEVDRLMARNADMNRGEI